MDLVTVVLLLLFSSKSSSISFTLPSYAGMSNLDASVASVLRAVRALLTDRTYFWYTAALVIIGDAILTQLIIRFIPCWHLFRPYMLRYRLSHSSGRYGN